MALWTSRGLTLLAAAAAAAAAAAGCTEPAAWDGPAITAGVERIEVPLITARNVDLLFVIDDSPAMAPQRAKLLESYRRFIAVLETIPGGLYDIHIGVVTADVGTRGTWDSSGPAIGTGPGSCTSEGEGGELRRASSVDGNFLSDVSRPDGTRERNYAGSLADAFAQLADVGAAGCTYPRPLEAMRRALANPANAGFRREGAALAVMLITNDDDCSFGSWSLTGGTLDRSRCAANAGLLVPTEAYLAALKSSAGVAGRVFMLGAFEPPGAPACADARPAPRLAAFLDGFPDRSAATSICGSDLEAPLALLRPLTPFLSLGLPCFSGPLLDVDPLADGLQADCAAWYSYLDRGAPVEQRIPPCRGDAPGPCWQLRREPPELCTGEVVDLRDNPRGFDGAAEARAIIECVSR